MGKAYLQTSGGKECNEEERTAHYRKWRKWRIYQMSDHLPMWTEFKIDFGREYLEEKAT